MPIRKKTPDSRISAFFDAIVTRTRDALEYRLPQIGEALRNEAVENGSYTDRTGNLRSSLGYVISLDGKILTGRFEKAGGGSGGTDGVAESKSYARKVAAGFPKGFVIVMVAGMRYAAYVSAKGYNVLDSAELIADGLVRKLLKDISKSAKA